MPSIGSTILNHKLTGGHFIGLGVANCRAFDEYPLYAPSSRTGFLNAAGNVFNFDNAANALTAIAQLFGGAGQLVLSAGILLEDMGDRVVFSAAGQTIAIFAKVRQLAQSSYEGSEKIYYACIWAGSPAGVGAAEYETLVGVARL